MSHSLLSKIHPAVVFLYFCLTGGIVLFCMDPILFVTAFLGAAITAVAYAVPWDHRFSGFLCAMVVLFTLGNPLFSHNGQTILFLLNDRPVTLEAIVYGAVSGVMVAVLLSLSRLFTRYMTADRIHALFSRISPRLALFFSMTLRFIPLLTQKAHTVRLTQRSIGKVGEGGMAESIRSEARVFSVMTGWVLENGIVTADSMASRGYGIARRTSYSVYRFRAVDSLRLLLLCALSAVTICGISLGWIGFRWYPSIVPPAVSTRAVASYLAYAILCILPGIFRLREVFLWHRLRSVI